MTIEPNELPTDEYDTLFNWNVAPDAEYVLKETSRSNNSGRTQTVLMKLKSIESDVTNEYDTPEWVDDFNNKTSILRSHYSETSPEELYIELFGSLDAKCNLLIDRKHKDTASSFAALEGFIEDHDHVFLYNQVFSNRTQDRNTGAVKYYGRGYDQLIGLTCFVIDLDEITADNIQMALDMVAAAPILPNYINHTGNGLHLYYLFDQTHDLKGSTWRMACYNGTKSKSELVEYVNIKQGMIDWFSGFTGKSDTDNHLAQPSRLFGSKSKNPNVRTILFKGSDTKHSIQYIAGLFKVDLPDEDSIRNWVEHNEAVRKQKKKLRKAKKPSAVMEVKRVVPTVDETETVVDDGIDTRSTSKYNFTFDGVAQRMMVDSEFEVDSFEYQMRQVWAEKKARASAAGSYRGVAQRNGLLSQYKQFKQLIMDGVIVGKRAKCLHVFWNRAPYYGQDAGVILGDFYDLLSYCNCLSTKKVTDDQVKDILTGPHCDYTNESILNAIGIKIEFHNKKVHEFDERRDVKKDMWKLIMNICEAALSVDPKLNYSKLTKIVNEQEGIKVNNKTLTSRPEIRELRSRLGLK